MDASAAVIVDVQNTLVNNALLRWGTPEQKRQYLPKLATNMLARMPFLKPVPAAMPLP